MAKKVEMNLEESLGNDTIVLDTMEMESSMETIPIHTEQKFEKEDSHTQKNPITPNTNTMINCLRKERIIVKYLPKENGNITNPKHLLYGGMAEGASRTFVVPRLSSGMYVNVLTDSEKDFLESIMGLEPNAMSIYRKKDNYWDDSNNVGISRVRLTKTDNYFNLEDPEDFIRYKILLANKDYIAASLTTLQEFPKTTYQFVIIVEGEEAKLSRKKMNIKKQCYMEYGKVEDDIDTLRTVVEIVSGRPTAPTSKLDFLQGQIDNLITADSQLFYKVITDPMLRTRTIIRKSIENGLISNRNGFLYLTSDGSALCEVGQDPSITEAVRFLNSPKRQNILLTLEAKLKQ